MTLSATAPAAADLAVLQDTIVQLNGLVTAYGQILAQAKQQLEGLDVTEAHIAAISDRLADRLNYSRVINRIIDQIHYPDSEACGTSMERLLTSLTERVTTRLADEMTKQVNASVESTLSRLRVEAREQLSTIVNDRLDGALESRIDTRLRGYTDAKAAAKSMLQLAYGPDVLDTIGSMAAEQLRADQSTAE